MQGKMKAVVMEGAAMIYAVMSCAVMIYAVMQ